MRITPEDLKVEDISWNKVFVFGSNEAGIHGAGAAKFAIDELDAKTGLGFGSTAFTFAIPTKDWGLKVLSLDVIMFYIGRFIQYAKRHPERDFYVTQIGCGLAGYTPEDIAPLFKETVDLENVYLPESFWKILK